MTQALLGRFSQHAHSLRPSGSLMLAFAIGLAFSGQLFAQVSTESCGAIAGGTVDYRLPKSNHVHQVEGAHFPPIVEFWIRGNRGPLGADIDYTILHIPNHHRALVSIKLRADKLKVDKLPNMRYPVECYFERAIRFTPDDHIARMLYAQFLVGRTRQDEAVRQLDEAARLSSDNGLTMLNIGLIYFDMKEFDKALAFAHKSMALGVFRPELRQRLEGVGRWADAPVPAASAAKQP